MLTLVKGHRTTRKRDSRAAVLQRIQRLQRELQHVTEDARRAGILNEPAPPSQPDPIRAAVYARLAALRAAEPDLHGLLDRLLTLQPNMAPMLFRRLSVMVESAERINT